MMDDMQEMRDLYRSRDEMLRLIDMSSLDELSTIVESTLVCTFIVIPRENMMYFSDGMKKILDAQTMSQGVLLSTYTQFVIDSQRMSVENAFSEAFKDLVLGATKVFKNTHTLKSKVPGEEVEVEAHMQTISIDRETYIIGFMIDKTKSLMEKAAVQLFEGDIDERLFIYDIYEDVCYLSHSFEVDFDLLSPVIHDMSNVISHYLHPDDEELFRSNIKAFMNNEISDFVGDYRFLSQSRGEIILRSRGFSSAAIDETIQGVEAGFNSRYITGCFSDITDMKEDEAFRNNLIEGTSAITFCVDTKLDTAVFSENIREVLPDIQTELNGDYLERIAQRIIHDDRKRFRDMMHQIIEGQMEKISIEVRVRDDAGRPIWIACRGKSFYNASRQSLMLVGMIFDLTRMNEVREDVERNASCHELTGFPTRERLMSDAQEMFNDRDVLYAGVVLVDINDFHTYNDHYGRSSGNEILIALSNLLQKNLPENSSLYHIGVDTFCVLWPKASRKKIEEFMAHLQEESIRPLEMGRGSFFVSYGMSAALYPSGGKEIDELLVHAEIALHKVKQDKKLKYAIYSPSDKEELKDRLDLEMQISQSIRNNMESFQLYYQPLINAKTEKLEGAEALLRWVAPNGELMNPEKVVNTLESTDQMEVVSGWILEKAVEQCATWLRNGAPKDFYVHINITADDIIRQDYANDVRTVLARHNVSPKNILLEVTETSLMKDLAHCRQNMIRLRNESIRVALDDFGTGYSSFNYLRELPVDEIKIDKAFVDEMETQEFERLFIESITKLAHAINKNVCVEGIETETQAKQIRDMGADVLQGYYYGKPMTVFNFENLYFKSNR